MSDWFCVHCGGEIVYRPTERGPWNTGWIHKNGYNHCDPSPDGNSDRGEPDYQMRLDLHRVDL